jgi:hypothetical protein
MVEQAPQYRLGRTDVDPFDENTADHRVARHRLRTSARTDYPEDSVPLFLSDYEGEPDPSQYTNPLRKDRRLSLSSRILAVVVATAATAVLFALFSSDAARDIIANASSTAVLSGASAAVQPNPTQLTARDMQLKDPAQSPDPTRLSAPANQTPGIRSVTAAAVAPTREEITTAYQSALQSGPPGAAVVAEPMIPGDAIHHLDPSEIVSSLKRGDALIASGDLAAARLVLRRAADAGDARAAMTLAETYDPAILEKLGVHGVVPDLAMARGWYEKAKQFGATEAAQRLELLASKQH